MAASLFSQYWFQVADLKIRLRPHVAVHRHVYREQVWFVLQDHATGQFHRFTPGAWHIIGLMDGCRSLQTIWEQACDNLGDAMPSQDEVIDLVARLFQANLLCADSSPDIAGLYRRFQKQEQRRLLQKLKSPLSLKVPLYDPDRLLTRTLQFMRPLFSVWGVLIWLAVVITGLVLAGLHWQALTGNLSDRILALENVMLVALVYPFVKIVHELGHGYTVKHWGGEVHEVGVMFMVFFPVPYVDATAASAFHSRYQRMLTSAAGILVEVFIAALAMVVWSLVEPGVVRAIAFNTMLIAGVSTLLFNGNPLLRFDAYYVLSDWLEIPNLATRGNHYLGYLCKRYLFGVQLLESRVASLRESCWLAGYAISSYLYRLLVMITIALFIASQYFVIGTVLALWLLMGAFVMPAGKLLRTTVSDPSLAGQRIRLWMVTGSALATIIGLLAFVPFPHATLLEGVMTPSEQAMVRTRAGGFVERLNSTSGQPVEAGQMLAELADPVLNARAQVQKANVEEAKAQYRASVNERTVAELNREVLRFRREELDDIRRQQQLMTIESSQPGVFYPVRGADLEGRYLARGELLGYVIRYQDLPVKLMVPEDDIELVRHQSRTVEVRFVSDRSRTWSAEIARIAPAATRQLPSEVLTLDGGGAIATNPSGDDNLQAFHRYFSLDLVLAEGAPARLNERVYVLFHHDPEPLVYRWFRDIRRVFLRHLDV